MTLHEELVIEAARRVVRTQNRRIRKGQPYVPPFFAIALLAAALAALVEIEEVR